MINYELVENQLNAKAKKILLLIREDYFDNMSNEKKSVLDGLLESDKVVIVNRGVSKFNDKTLAHGGRTLRDGKIHFYPDVREFESDQEIVEKCRSLLPHECFHYFIQPDKLELANELEMEIASFFTEGLVEREARRFYERHKDHITFEKSNYGFNINFVNMIQDRLGATTYQIIFSEDDYLRDIGKYTNEYEKIINRRKTLLNVVNEIAKDFPRNLKRKAANKMRTMILQDGNADCVKEKLKSFRFLTSSSLENLEESIGPEL